MIFVATPDPKILRHLQSQGHIKVWSETPGLAVEIRVRLMRDPKHIDLLRLEAKLDEITPGWTYE